MEIQYKTFDGRYTHYLTTEVVLVEAHKGHEIYQDTDGWFFVQTDDNWQYFGTKREAKKFINAIWSE